MKRTNLAVNGVCLTAVCFCLIHISDIINLIHEMFNQKTPDYRFRYKFIADQDSKKLLNICVGSDYFYNSRGPKKDVDFGED